jgi:hypothetical protein
MRKLIAAAASLALLCPSPAYADALHDALEAYALYQNDVSTLLDAEINGRTVDPAIARVQRHRSDRVASGWIAYGALTAAQSPRFADSIEARIRAEGRASVLRQLRGDTTYARRQQTPQAIQLILNAASADDARASQAGARYDRYARSSSGVQLTSAASLAEIGGVTRLTAQMRDRLRIGAGDARPMNDADAFGGRAFWDSLAGRNARAARSRGGREAQSYASVTDHMLTLAAIVVADAERGERRRVSALLDEPLTQQCMTMQRLQLRQCLSVTVDVGERAYCLGHHALTGPGSCFSAVVR